MAPSTDVPVPATRQGLRVLPVGIVVVASLAGMLVAGSVGGIFTPPVAFADGGFIARNGIPVARAIHDAFGAATVGLLLLAGTMIPDTTRTSRRETACRWAARTGVAWVLAGTVTMLLIISNVTAIPVDSPSFPRTVGAFVWSVDFFRVYLISVLVALVATVGAATVRTKPGMVWMAALSIAAYLPLALAGHSGGSMSHDTAVNSLAVHLAAAAVWCGGLVGLIMLRSVLGEAAGVTVHRYSVLAVWCFGGIAVSGLLNGAVRLGEADQLTSSYGLLLLLKAGILTILGGAGLMMRRRIVAGLTSGAGMAGAFTRLALLEVTLMGIAMGLGVGLARSATPVPRSRLADPDIAVSLTGYPAPTHALTTGEWFTLWRIDWLWLAVALLGMGLYAAGQIRLYRRGDAWPWGRTVAWMTGWLLFVWTTSGSVGIYGKVQFSLHMLMHMLLTMGIPIFLAQGAPLTLAARALRARRDKTMGPREIMLAAGHSRWLSFMCNPIIASINFAGSLYVFYFTGLFELAMRTHTGHIAMIVHFMLAGYVFCWSLIGVDPGPKRWPPSLRLIALFATMSFHAFFGVTLMSTTTLLAGDFFRALSLPWVGDLLADQHAGGGITWGIGELPMLYLALMTALTWMRADEHDARRLDRQAERDHGAALEAYNAELARRADEMRRAEDQWRTAHRR